MTLEQLRIFLAVAEQEHVTSASKVLNKTPSAVSAAISALENRHDVRLFDRIGRDIRLTADGRRFVAAAKAVLSEADRASGLLAGFSKEPSGPLKIAASQTVATYWLPNHLTALQANFPGIAVDLTTLNTRQSAEMVITGSVDIAIVEGLVSGPDLKKQVVAHDRLVIVVAPGHPWSDGRPLSVSDLETADWILREKGSGTRAALEDELSDHLADGAKLDNATVMPSNEACLAAIRSGRHATAVSELSAAPHLESGRLMRANFTFPERAFVAITHPERHRSRAVEALMDELLI